MRVTIPNLGVVEGSPQEIADLLNRVGVTQRVLAEFDRPATPSPPMPIPGPELASAADATEVSVSIAPKGIARQAHLPPHGSEPFGIASPLRNAPNNDRILFDFEEGLRVTDHTKRKYMAVAREFERHISPKSFLDVTQADVRGWERSLIEGCRYIHSTALYGRGKFGPLRSSCKKGVFTKVLAKPDVCRSTCPMFARQLKGPQGRLGALKQFYTFLRDVGLVPSNPVEGVARQHTKSLGKRHALGKYVPTLRETRSILRVLKETGSPRDYTMVLALAKWGRRPEHILLLHSTDIIGLKEGDTTGELPTADFTTVRDRMEHRNRGGHTKLQGNIWSPVDAELRDVLVNFYMPWRTRHFAYNWEEGPLFPEYQRGRYWTKGGIQFALDRTMRQLAERADTDEERQLWESHLEPGPLRITPGCFRQFFCTTLMELHVPEIHIDILRGDVIPGSKRNYIKLTRELVHGMYQMPRLIASDAGDEAVA